MQQLKPTLIYGFAIFAMFFGSGNLVFPLEIGHVAGGNWLIGFLGLFITGITLPFLGLFVIKLHRGKYQPFFGEAGRFAQIILPLFTLSLMGCFGVVPRCITVAHGGLSYLFPEISLWLFSAVFCVVTFFLCLREKVMVNIIGKWMSPILLMSIVALIVVGIIKAPVATQKATAQVAFVNGFLTGYQTMDLFAAFFFSALVFAQLQQMMPKSATTRETLMFALKPSIFGAVLLGLVYLGFVYLSGHYSGLISHVEPQEMLPTIAMHTLGSGATLLIAVVMIFSCLSTAVALNNIYARYLCSMFNFKESNFYIMVLLTTVISFVFSLLKFTGISAFIAPVLVVSYPGLIALTIMSILTRNHAKLKFYVFYAITLAMFVYELNLHYHFI